MKILFIVIDGLGDKPIKALNNKTPLESVKTPNLDWLAQNGVCGLLKPFYTSAIPTSEQGHFSLFGYNPKKYQIRRGIFTALGSDLKMKKGDVALRGNLASVGKKLNIIDRRTKRIKNIKPLVKDLNGIIIDKVKFLLAPAGEHRVGIVLRGKGLSAQISDGDPHYSKLGKKIQRIKALDDSLKAKFTAQVLNKFLDKAYQVLKTHTFNEKREKQGLLTANYILVRGASSVKKIPSFKKRYGLNSACIAGKLLYQQIGQFLGMKLIKVKGANGLVTTNLKGKVLAAKKSLGNYDFVFLHIKAADSLSEDGNYRGKKEFIEKIDKQIKVLRSLKDTLIIVTADHSTCCELKTHCSEPIPVLIYGRDKDAVDKFSEKACQKGKLGKIDQLKLMPKILSIKK